MEKKCKVKKKWVDIEMEHSHHFPKKDQRKIARKIAKDHVKELGCGYYPGLIKLEKKLKRKNR